MATAMLLKELDSPKKVYGFDSFSGFPPIYHINDGLDRFKELFEDGKITSEHFSAHNKLKKYRSLIHKSNIDVKNISSSSDFSDTSEKHIIEKADLLGLDNIIIVKGDFNKTMREGNYPEIKLMAALMDCDLYSSYKSALPYIWKRINMGGYIYLDEYYSLKFAGARIATDEFFKGKRNEPRMHEYIDGDFERWYVLK